jgi:hypothetical protein
MNRLFQGHYSLDPNATAPKVREYVNHLTDAQLLHTPEEELVENGCSLLLIQHASIDQCEKPNVERGHNATDPGFICFEHRFRDPSHLLQHLLPGMSFPVPRHEVVQESVLLRYDASPGVQDSHQRHEREFSSFERNVAAANTNADQFNNRVRGFVVSELKAARDAATSRDALAR